jgi:hypothetical protein
VSIKVLRELDGNEMAVPGASKYKVVIEAAE